MWEPMGEEERDTNHVCVFLSCEVIRFVVVAVMAPILTLLRRANVRLSRAPAQIEGGAVCEVNDRVQRYPSAPDVPEKLRLDPHLQRWEHMIRQTPAWRA